MADYIWHKGQDKNVTLPSGKKVKGKILSIFEHKYGISDEKLLHVRYRDPEDGTFYEGWFEDQNGTRSSGPNRDWVVYKNDTTLGSAYQVVANAVAWNDATKTNGKGAASIARNSAVKVGDHLMEKGTGDIYVVKALRKTGSAAPLDEEMQLETSPGEVATGMKLVSYWTFAGADGQNNAYKHVPSMQVPKCRKGQRIEIERGGKRYVGKISSISKAQYSWEYEYTIHLDQKDPVDGGWNVYRVKDKEIKRVLNSSVYDKSEAERFLKSRKDSSVIDADIVAKNAVLTAAQDAKYRKMGEESFKKGEKLIPAASKTLMRAIAEEFDDRIGSPDGVRIRSAMKAWSNGWNKANLEAPVIG